MGRPAGSRNVNYDSRRAGLAASIFSAIQARTGRASLRDLAVASGVSVSTLRHYFGDRNGLLDALLEVLGEELADTLEQVISELPVPFSEALPALMAELELAVAGPLRDHLRVALVEGLATSALHRVLLYGTLAPSLLAIEDMLEARRDQLVPNPNLRVAAVALVTPLFFCLLDGAQAAAQTTPEPDEPPYDPATSFKVTRCAVQAHIASWQRAWVRPPEASPSQN